VETLILFITIVAVLAVLFAFVAYGAAWLWWRSLNTLERTLYRSAGSVKLWPAAVGVAGAARLIARCFACRHPSHLLLLTATRPRRTASSVQSLTDSDLRVLGY